MINVGDAAQQLGIGRVTLEKWMKRLGIEPTRNSYDWRFHEISEEDLRRIRWAREQMPAQHTSEIVQAPQRMSR